MQSPSPGIPAPHETPRSGLELQGICKTFDSTIALDDLTLRVPPRSIVAILGPSGSGKSTLLSVIAGLEAPDRGHVIWDGECLDGVPAHQRNFGLMFQDYALFPHLDVGRNVAFGLEMQRWPVEAMAARVLEVLAQVGLAGFEQRDVNTLSGGEQQRVALARALAPRPRLLMLDEPLGALDRTLREHLLAEMHHILRLTQQTALIVTHDQEEAFSLADRVVILDSGRVLQEGEPQHVYHHPASEAVARFLGLTNLLRGEPVPGGLRTPLGLIPMEPAGSAPCTVLLRPESARLDGQGAFSFEATLIERMFRGSTCLFEVEANGQRLKFEMSSAVSLPPEGSGLRLSLDPQCMQLLP